ncbi:hypothetical protein [Brunnivagina elsteri]|uniref:Uncharacterized protein n=1 Tax=Brunnivagina elsteri CCALA 953 TaxID=987040 RepID=A0A2A2TED7_9CYAN|nr:hypothetical protein [Calothrix elsteri]PAX52061.1 hypothetical protein CK510_21380 [Calothrix elsteri CCALA 953]
MLCKNVKTQDASRRFNPCNSANKREGLGSLQIPSRSDGVKQIGFDTTNCTGENTTGTTSQSGETTNGKILERLEFIENAYLSYVQSHQQRLEACLVESKEHEAIFKEAIQALKQDIHDLASDLDK